MAQREPGRIWPFGEIRSFLRSRSRYECTAFPVMFNLATISRLPHRRQAEDLSLAVGNAWRQRAQDLAIGVDEEANSPGRYGADDCEQLCFDNSSPQMNTGTELNSQDCI
ncbi:hypothetical protein [Streptomyces sp. NPDC056192]|uniref:hypothetical protein n=1 Tax=Streptomyces sp. NPDC056192 TaxID=3345743 RepID=UPI0035DE831D